MAATTVKSGPVPMTNDSKEEPWSETNARMPPPLAGNTGNVPRGSHLLNRPGPMLPRRTRRFQPRQATAEPKPVADAGQMINRRAQLRLTGNLTLPGELPRRHSPARGIRCGARAHGA